MHQFFVKPEQIGEKDIIIEGTDVNHIRNVLRMKEGEELTICTGQDDKFYRCEVAESSPELCAGKDHVDRRIRSRTSVKDLFVSGITKER